MINISNVTKLMNGIPLYSGASFQIYPGEKVGLVGPNGTGKTTFFRMIVGEERPDEGSISIESNVRVAYFSQKSGEMHGRTALEEVMAGNERVADLAHRLAKYNEDICNPEIDPDEMNKILEKMGDAQTEFEKLGGYEMESNAEEILTGLGIHPEEHNKMVEEFSGGWRMRIALAKVLIVMPDLILMDEPTNYLDMETIMWLEKWLINFKGAILMTTHDKDFMNNVVNKIVEIKNGKVTSFTGNYDFYEKESAIRKKQNEASVNRQQAMLKKEEDFIARFKARASHAAQVQSRVKKLDKIERVELEMEEEEMSILLPEIPRGGNDVVVIKDLKKSWGDKLIFEGLSATVHRQDRVAVVGVNGAGKSTFLKIIAGETQATSGSATVGPSIDVGYFGQSTLENLHPENTVLEEVALHLTQASDGFLRNLLAAMLFKGDEVFKKIKYLSGGEKARVILAYLLTEHHNLLILDEPTNHLDIKSRMVLLDTLHQYQGTVMIVSHDRFFLRELATRVFKVDRGHITVYEGDYNYYLTKDNQ